MQADLGQQSSRGARVDVDLQAGAVQPAGRLQGDLLLPRAVDIVFVGQMQQGNPASRQSAPAVDPFDKPAPLEKLQVLANRNL